MSVPRRAHRRPLSYWLSLLLFGILAGGLAVFFWVGTMRQQGPPLVTSRSDDLSMVRKKREMVVRNMTLEGRDDDGNPFHIEAVRSRRPNNDRDTMIFEDAIGEIRDSSGNPVNFEADALVYHQDTRLAELKGNVVIEKPDKWTLTGPLVHVDTRNSTLRADQPVVVHTDAGTVHARGMRSDKASGRTIFTGPVHAVFDASSETSEEDEVD